MHPDRLKALACTISRGGFSGERLFALDEIDHSGIASRSHMWKQNGAPLDEGEPPIGEVIPGLVAVRIIEERAMGRFLISIPDGEVIEVPSSQLLDRPSGVRHRTYLTETCARQSNAAI